ncbi:hypothetical protein BKA70DRAFT_1438404 [Coprinopsis sp. MPI-PUGE-AT-0042]|nr:hypothetical protein BKA70DRAFT_1438404 [Coprinopsis sp. MPI-PUGE-AT-0042]
MTSLPLTTIIESLRVPTAYSRYEETSPELRVGLDKWREDSTLLLKELLICVKGEAQLDRAQTADAICAAAPLAVDFNHINMLIEGPRYKEEETALKNECPWIHPSAQAVAQEILQVLDAQDQELWKHILEKNVKPTFIASNPHPHLNPRTGKSLPQSQVLRPPQQGGFSSVTQDFFVPEGQRWKSWVGLGAVLYWCVVHLEEDTYEAAWHLVIPPLMTFLDDYQPQYKLWGLLTARTMLSRVPNELLRKTGIDGLLRTSFKKALSQLESPLSPPSIRLAVSQTVRLTLLTTQVGSQQRFDTLCALLGEGIITGIWVYAFDKPDILRATLDALPEVIKTLDLGCCRFLRTLVPQLVQPMIIASQSPPIAGLPMIDPVQLHLQLSSLKALLCLMEVCAPLLHSWRLTILDGLARSWVSMIIDRGKATSVITVTTSTDLDSDDEDEFPKGPKVTYGSLPISPEVEESLLELNTLLRQACSDLTHYCPSMQEEEYHQLLQTDPRSFEGLFTISPPSTANSA